MKKLNKNAGDYAKQRNILILGLLLFLWSPFCMAEKKVLIYTKNGKGYVHENIPASVACLEKICKDNNWTFQTTDDASVFTKEKISKFDVLVFSNTNNETFDTEEQKKVFQEYIRDGGGFVGIHSACGSERQWPWFWANLGGKFEFHPPQEEFDIKIIDKKHASTAHLPLTWKWTDECYFLNELNPDIHILIAVDIRSLNQDNIKRYSTRRFGDYFPLAWCHEFDGGRQWYTALGHNDEHYEDENFVKHLTGGIRWAMTKETSKKSK